MKKAYLTLSKCFTLCLLALLLLISHKSHGQFPVKTEVAYHKLLLRIEVSKHTDESFLLKLSPVAADTLQLKSEATLFINEWKDQVFQAAIRKLMSDLSEDSSYEKSKYHPALDTFLIQSFSRLEAKRFAASTESLAQLNYGLREEDITTLERHKLALLRVQDTIRYLKAMDKVQRDQYFNQKKTNEPATKTPSIREVINKMSASQLQNQGAVLPASYTIDTLKIVRDILKKEINRINSRRKFLVSLIGNANVVSSFKSVDRSEINAGFGVIASKPGFAEFMGILTVAQTDDEINSANKFDFGQCLLVPGIRRFSLLTSYRTYSIFRHSPSQLFKKIGFGLDFNATPYRWINDSDSIKVIPFALNFIFPYTWILQSEPGKDFAISTELGLTTRFIGGDATKEQLSGFIGTEKRFYIGAVAGLNIKYNALRAQFHAPILFGKDRVPGLTHGQVYASIGIVGSLISDITGILKNKKEETLISQ